MRHGALFNGIAGFMLAAEWMGWENVFSVEIDDWCNNVSKKNFPNVIQYGDIKTFKGEAGSVDILTGGFPCQPFSHAGFRKGKSDDRYLWPEYLRIIREIKPTYVVGENVAGLISMEDGKILDGIFTDLEDEGYNIESFIIPACG
ncbi:MAG TPA: DNA (cytosine-5-)-methyltransferase, partial [bacterium]|nr:DNA (cytosine-5-)-methyltransferase [bacterium]